MTTLAIVGAGFSGTLLTLHLLRRCPPSTRIELIQRQGQFGPGTAYGTKNSSHLLNVPAGKMSAFHDHPDDFFSWLIENANRAQMQAKAERSTFVPRSVFGRYIRDLLIAELRRPANHGRLHLVRGEAQAMEERGRRLAISLDRGRWIEADLVVLAVGNFPPETPSGLGQDVLSSDAYKPDPWAIDTLAGLNPSAPVLMIGTGLTMIDMVITLLDQGHTGPIYALSRRGLLPHRHASGSPYAGGETSAFPSPLADLLHVLRDRAQQAVAAGFAWQSVVDELRPFTADLWRTMSEENRRRFLRHARPWWEVHRHRTPPEVAQRIEAALARGQLQIHAGRILGSALTEAGIAVTFRRRHREDQATLVANRLINCSGPGCDYARIPDPIIRQLLDCGRVRPDPLRLGLDVTPSCAVLRQDGAISRNLFAVGPVTKGAFWEMTAVPDIRRQCELLAAHLATVIASTPAPASLETGALPPAEGPGMQEPQFGLGRSVRAEVRTERRRHNVA